MRQPCVEPSVAETSATCRPLTVVPKSHVNSVIPNAANGTKRALTSPCSSRAHSIDPTPIPTANIVSSNVTT